MTIEQLLSEIRPYSKDDIIRGLTLIREARITPPTREVKMPRSVGGSKKEQELEALRALFIEKGIME